MSLPHDFADDLDLDSLLPVSTPAPDAARLLGALVELSTAMTGRAPIVWRGYVCMVTERTANVTEAAADPMFTSIPVDQLLQLQVVEAPDPAIRGCGECQEDTFFGRMLCDRHKPAGLPD